MTGAAQAAALAALPRGGGTLIPDPAAHRTAGTTEAGNGIRSMFWIGTGLVPKSKSNYRNNSGESWKRHQDFETSLFAQLRQYRPDAWLPSRRDEPIKERPAVVAALAAHSLLDAGNLSKSVLDAGEGVLYANDAQVLTCVDAVHRTRTSPGLVAVFAQLHRPVPLPEALTHAAVAATALANLLSDPPAPE